eukprot:scaffold126_cov142-Skeletonema_marinoi.AAC.3
MNNNTPYHPSKHQSGDDSRRIASSGASASFEALELEAKISSLEMLRVRMASEYSSPSKALSQDTAAAADKARVASDMQILRIRPSDDDVRGEDEDQFKRETSQHAKQLRTALALGSAHPNDLSEDDWINCTGIEPFVLFSRSILRQLQEKKLAHIEGILAAQRHLNPSDLARVSHRSSNDARRRAYKDYNSIIVKLESTWTIVDAYLHEDEDEEVVGKLRKKQAVMKWPLTYYSRYEGISAGQKLWQRPYLACGQTGVGITLSAMESQENLTIPRCNSPI